MIKTTIKLICGHAYAHSGAPTEPERRTAENLEPEVQCPACRSSQKIVDAKVNASR